MKLRIILGYVGRVLKLEGLLLAVPLLLALLWGEGDAARGFAAAIALTLLAGLLIGGRRFQKSPEILKQEGFVIVALCWIVLSLFGALPYFFSGAVPSFLNAVFESVSAFTTTAATTVGNVELLPRSLLLWMGLSHWIGGMGVLVLLVALTPRNGENSYNVVVAELPGHAMGRMVPKLRQNAMLLYGFYVGLTVLLFALLLAGGMPPLDSLVSAFATAGTGGFSIRSASIASYGSLYVEMVLLVFMLLFALNFSVYYFLLTRNLGGIKANEEVRWFLGVAALSTLLIAGNLATTGGLPVGEAFRRAGFQVSSAVSTAGFATADTGAWPQFSKAMLFCLGLLGACSGSTGGGLKVSRLIILLKEAKRRLYRQNRPRMVEAVHLDGKAVSKQLIHNVNTYFITFIALFGGAVLLVAADGFDAETTLSAVAACIGNTGSGFGEVAGGGGYGAFSPLSRGVLMAAMFLGRLEIYPLLLLFVPGTWRNVK